MSADAEENASLMSYSGWVKRKGTKQGLWHKRYMTLTGSELKFSKDEEQSKIEQSITLPPSTTARQVEAPNSFRFEIVIPEVPPILLLVETPQEMNRWIAAIRSVSSPTMKNLSMSDFKIISVLGRGFYGKVMLVQKNDTGELYAVKSVRKSRLAETGKANTIIAERNIMMKAHHPFIVNLCFAFQTPTKFYLGLEYAPGGELFYHMDRLGVVQIDDARLYTAEIGLALSYLHSLGIVYRDLKPENILLDKMGHIKLTDFGLSKDLVEDGKTSTFCGTSEYLAPEVVMQMPYSYPIDIWALGILCYEMILGATPFYDENKSKMFSNIVSAQPYFPPQLDRRIADFISKLLCKNPAERPTFEDMKTHPFFEGFNWTKVMNKEYRPNFVPQTKDPLSPTNFDPEFTNEVPVDSFVPEGIGEVGNVPGFSYFDANIKSV